MLGYTQIQSMPTAQLWVGALRAPRNVVETADAGLALVNFNNPSPVSESVSGGNPEDSISLSDFQNPSPLPETIPDTSEVSIGLTGFVPAVPFTRTETDAEPSALFALTSFGNPSPHSRTPGGSDVGSPKDGLALAVFNPNFESETVAWLAAVAANSGTVSASTAIAANQWCVAIKAAGIRSKILRWNFLCGDAFGTSNVSTNLGAVQVPYIADKGVGLDTSDTVQQNWTYQERGTNGGLKRLPSGAAGHLLTGFVPALAYSANNNAGFCVYVATGSTESTWCMGVSDGSGNDAGLIGPDFTALGTRPDIWKPGTAISDSLGKGFYHVTKGSSGDVLIYKNGSLFGTTTNPGGNRVNTFQFYIFSVNL
jgi:hypothetical protein